MSRSTVTTKGRVTIPKHIRDCLGLLPGDKLRFEYEDAGAVRIVPPRRSAQIKGRKSSRFSAPRGTRKTGMSTDEIMTRMRDRDEDAGDPGFNVATK